MQIISHDFLDKGPRWLSIALLMSLASCNLTVYDRTENNYGKEIEQLASEFDLPAEFLKALVVLESSGNRDVPSRFERHVFNRLVDLRKGKRKRYENLTTRDVKDASDAALKNLASSWGPFQIMGYKCLGLGVKVNDLRGEKALYWGIYWIDREYGDYLRREQFKEAFRIHNTGSPTGKTYDPDYVKNGMEHIRFFSKRK